MVAMAAMMANGAVNGECRDTLSFEYFIFLSSSAGLCPKFVDGSQIEMMSVYVLNDNKGWLMPKPACVTPFAHRTLALTAIRTKDELDTLFEFQNGLMITREHSIGIKML
jgi:hypothetical protein